MDSMNQHFDPFLHFVKANLAMLCSACDKGYIQGVPSPYETCIQCGGTGRIPRPKAVELWAALTEPEPGAGSSDIKVGRVPRSESKQQVALIDWVVKYKFAISTWPRERDGVQVWQVEPPDWNSIGNDFIDRDLRRAVRIALVAASGWTDVKEEAVNDKQQSKPWESTVLSASEGPQFPWNGYEEMRAAQAQHTWEARQPEIDQLRAQVARLRELGVALIHSVEAGVSHDTLYTAKNALRAVIAETEEKS